MVIRPFLISIGKFGLACCLALQLLLGMAHAVQTSSDGLSLNLSDEARSAVDAGVPLVFSCRFAVRDYWWFVPIESNTIPHRFTLMRHTLSNSYIVKRDSSDTPHIFRSIPEASNFITTQALNLLESYSTDAEPYSMRISLNKFDLPTPMRLKAFIAEAWDIDTGWIIWASAN